MLLLCSFKLAHVYLFCLFFCVYLFSSLCWVNSDAIELHAARRGVPYVSQLYD